MEYFKVLEYVGIITFAASGALAGIEFDFDYLGVIFLSFVTALGGGISRDVCLGNTPPLSFYHPEFFLVCFVVAVLCIIYFLLLRKNSSIRKEKLVLIINILDAFGVAAFCVSAVQITLEAMPAANPAVIASIALLTCVGGGIIRDLIANRKPVVLHKEIYCTVIILGAVVYYYLLKTELPSAAAISVSLALMVSLRLIAIAKKLNIPHIKLEITIDADSKKNIDE